RAHARRSDRALPRHSRHPGERADAVVLLDADHLSLVPGQRAAVQMAVQPEPVHAPRRVISGDPVLQRTAGPLEVAPRARRLFDRAVPRVLLVVRSAARLVRRGCLMRTQSYLTTQRKLATETRRPSAATAATKGGGDPRARRNDERSRAVPRMMCLANAASGGDPWSVS